jgi:F-type H+-transporting ATPase subunit b
MGPSPLDLAGTAIARAALVDIDATLFILVGVFLFLYIVLRITLFRPVLRVLDERERRIDGAKAEAKAMQERAEGAMSEYEAFVREARSKGAELKAALRQEGQRIERTLLDEVRRETEAQLAQGKAELRSEMERQATALSREAETLARRAAERLLGRPLGTDDERRSLS